MGYVMPAMILALLLALIALYVGNSVGAVVGVIAAEEDGIHEPMEDRTRFADFVRTPEFPLFLLTAVVVAGGVNWSIAIPLCLAGLLILRLPKYLGMWPQAVAINAEWQVYAAVAASSAHSLAGAMAMFTIGAGAAWLLG